MGWYYIQWREKDVKHKSLYVLGESFDPSEMITNSVVNVISAVVFGHRFSIDDGIFQNLVKCNHSLLEIIGSAWGRVSKSQLSKTFIFQICVMS